MASSLATASAITKATSLSYYNDGNCKYCPISKVSFRLSHKPNLRFVTSQGLQSSRRSTVVKAQLNEVAVDGSSNAAASPSTKSDAPTPKESSEPSPSVLATEESISEFISQVASLVKLVDSRDIVELRMKQLDCEVVIRKKEALPQPPPPPIPMAAVHALPPAYAPPASPAPAQASSPAPAAAPPPPAAKSAKSSLPPLKCPMAGTFYRSSAPGEPPFVKVGDKVQKGQVLCIIEAMKLMNEIEADQSGTIVEILVDDSKPVSVDTPLFVIQP
ncbi:biotin carboxyl carrier protein of acetyl-CoA carboxylase, chloroplastic [Morus notabilis]|uniref:biotin carboxyl carrier protein of acetyl-CoA carboxylase, chloroplastic n=1 Tax=Morus notabilis TaxID=981085 RepID=UPI000CECE7A5|nr:biotin carboxyl carrier protein of acetyl-CoA carboxylase, chloroplastic [Morus notabilis]